MTSGNFDVRDSDEFRSSPLSVLYSTEKEVRRRLADRAAIDNSPFRADMRQEGVTDYIAFPLRFTDGSIHSAIEIMSWRRTASSLLDTYVGNRAGERILGGQIRRGHTDTM